MMQVSRISVAVSMALGVAFGAVPASAMGGDSSIAKPGPPQKSAYAMAVDKAKAADYSGAIILLKKVVAAEPDCADAFNYLGYSYRNLNDLGNALTAYRRALAIDPNHKGANQYLGELYVRLGDLALAEKQLAKLDRLCSFGCAEYEELKRKIAAMRRNKGS